MSIKRDFLLNFSLILILVFSVQTLSPSCQTCHFIVKKIQKGTPISPLDKILSTIGVQYCAKKHIQDRNVCKGAVQQMIDPILNSLWIHFTDPHQICHKIFLCPKEYLKRNITEQLKNIVKDKPKKLWQKATNRKSFKILHMSDLHPDFFYKVGAEAKCSQPLCCRQSSQKTSLNAQVTMKAGYWGSIAACDLPIQTFDLFINEIKKQNPDFIIWTGDNTAHDIWQQTQSYNINFTTFLTQRLKNATNITVIPAMGNHQSYPVNVYNYDSDRQDMLKLALAQNWKDWIGNKAYNQLKTKGYYSVQLQKFNLKMISINTQAGNDGNFFLLKNPTDPGQMLDWLQKQLKDSQNKNQFVFIIGHIPPNNNMNGWAIRYNALIDRFSYTVRGQFFGHTHNDHVGIHYSVNNKSQLINYHLIAPSLTTYDNRLPRFRILDIDFDTVQIKNYHQYRLDLRKYQKQTDKPQFQLLYSFKQAYGLDDLRPQSGMTNFINKLKNDPNIQKKYAYYHYGGLIQGKPGQNWYCNTFSVPQQQAKCSGKQYKQGFVQKFGGQWRDLTHKN